MTSLEVAALLVAVDQVEITDDQIEAATIAIYTKFAAEPTEKSYLALRDLWRDVASKALKAAFKGE